MTSAAKHGDPGVAAQPGAAGRANLLEVEGLRVAYHTPRGQVLTVKDIGFTIAPGRRYGLIGESGSGKSSVVRAVLGLIRHPHQVAAERIELAGCGRLDELGERRLRQVRGRQLGYVGQNPFGALHPVLRLDKQFHYFLKAHGATASRRDSRARAAQALARLGLPDPERVLHGYAGQLSGGMAQRVAIAFASLLAPPLVIADEPTTALDVTVQRQVLDLLAPATIAPTAGLLLVTHDLSVVAQHCDEVIVMKAGEIVERGPVAEVFRAPSHPYTARLLASVLAVERPRGGPGRPSADRAARPSADRDSPVLRLDQVSKAFRRGGTTIQAVSGVSVEVTAGECVGIVGESGSGKSTLGRMALMLCRPDAGHVSLGGTDLGALSRAELRRARTRMQLVFQEPYQALNPQLRARQSVAEPLQLLLPQATRAEVRRRTDEALRLVGLDEARANRYPQNLSGGELQRVGIARAIALRPALIVLDEPTSSLDLTIRAEIVALLQRLQSELNMSYLFISHDLSTIEFAARRVYVMYRGRVVESGPTADVLSRPDHPYTRMLAAARLDPDPSVKPAPLPAAQPDAPPAPAGGCAFAPRCERRSGACAQEPGLLARPGGRDAACWHPIEPAADPVGQAGR